MSFRRILTNISDSPSAKILIGWTVIIGFGIEAFILAKDSIDRNRRQAMLSRQRMQQSNTEDYERPTQRTHW